MPDIDVTRLDELRQNADPVADGLAALYLDGEPGEMFQQILQARYATPDEETDVTSDSTADSRLRAWFDERPALPDWADQDKLDRGAEFFGLWGIQLGLGLFLSSLPLAYASHDGVQVLALTADLETDTKRRVLESAQFVLDVTAPDGLQPGGVGYHSARHVRLMHAGVRHLITSPHSRVPKTDDPSVWPRWDESWGVPINQEHMLGAMLSFSSSLLHVLDSLDMEYDPEEAEAFCHLWNVVGWLLGVDATLLPLERAEMDALEKVIRERNEKPSDAGTKMSTSLLELVESFIPLSIFKGAAVSTMRLFIGDDTADLLKAPPSDWTRVLIGALTSDDGRISRFLSNGPIARFVTTQLSKRVLKGFVEHERDGDRPDFEIPRRLGSVPAAPGPIRRITRKIKNPLSAGTGTAGDSAA